MNIKQQGKRFIRKQLEARGFDIVRRGADNGPALPLLRLLIEHSVLVDGRGAIIQVGANDGVMSDPVNQIISACRLPAILVEPLPDIFEMLVKTYANKQDIFFENAAVSDKPGTAEIFRVDQSLKNMPDWIRGTASFDKSILLKHEHIVGRNIDDHIVSVTVPVITIEQLLKRHSAIKKITAIQIDTEGHDFLVVKSAIDAGCLPRIFNYETIHLSLVDQIACRNLLASRGYSFLSNSQDTLAYRMN